MFKHKAASVLANMGVSLGMPSGQPELKSLIQRLHPVKGGPPLIRMGAKDDGGYVLPDDFEGVEACFSPGVDNRATFETDIAARGIRCFLADASVAQSPVDHELFEFLPKYLGVVNDFTTIRLDDWVAQSAPGNADLVLQMDIEGHEWPVLVNVSDAVLKRFRVIVIEAHFLDRLFDREGFTFISAALNRLLEHFVVVHNHPNNYGGMVSRGDVEIPRAQEISFLRRDRVTDWSPVTEFPHPLDTDNAKALPAMVLPECWHA